MVFESFPVDLDIYTEDMKPIVEKTIKLHGFQEWRAGVLTNELHGHLGIYTIIGVKMGVKALQHFQAGTGQVCVESFAGIMPPVSCMNDGLQVSTGATLGHGMISSPPTDNALVEAIFQYESKAILIKLKASVSSMIRNEIAGAIEEYGKSDAYWEYIRKLAINYWYELDRNEIFELHELKSAITDLKSE